MPHLLSLLAGYNFFQISYVPLTAFINGTYP
jgi:hypothetical protein